MKAFEGRVLALAAAHDLLIAGRIGRPRRADAPHRRRRSPAPTPSRSPASPSRSRRPRSCRSAWCCTSSRPMPRSTARSRAPKAGRASPGSPTAARRRAALQVQVGRKRRPQRGAAPAQRLRHAPDEARLRRRRGPVAADPCARRRALTVDAPMSGRLGRLHEGRRKPRSRLASAPLRFRCGDDDVQFIDRTLCASASLR